MIKHDTSAMNVIEVFAKEKILWQVWNKFNIYFPILLLNLSYEQLLMIGTLHGNQMKHPLDDKLLKYFVDFLHKMYMQFMWFCWLYTYNVYHATLLTHGHVYSVSNVYICTSSCLFGGNKDIYVVFCFPLATPNHVL